MPSYSQADILSNLFGNNASASTSLPLVDTNSQNMDLLQANVSSASLLKEKQKTGKDKDAKVVDENAKILSDGDALLAYAGPEGVSDGTDGDVSSDQISVYVVRKDDSIAKIAEMFGVTVNTIRWANDIKVGEKLKEGDILIILPVNGIKHVVKKGETLKGIAQKYKVDVLDIAGFNGIATDEALAVGDELIIPDAEMIDNGGDSSPAKTPKKDSSYYKKYPSQNIGGFINPVPEYKKVSQRLHGGPSRNGVDLAAPTGTPIVASASGTVIFARNGYNGGYGNMVIITHANGVETLYGHMSRIATQVGAHVSQGEIIGYVGSTGHSTGPHLHYEVHHARNNALDLPTFR